MGEKIVAKAVIKAIIKNTFIYNSSLLSLFV